MKTHYRKTLAMLCALATAAGSMGASVLSANAEAVLAQPAKAAVQTTKRNVTDCRSQFPLITLDSIPNSTGSSGRDFARCAPAANDVTEPSEKYLPLLLIAVSFADDETQEHNQIDTADNISDRYFGSKDSITSYYHDQSFGQFTFLPAKETSAFGVNDNPNTYDAENDGVVNVKLDATRPDLSMIPFYQDISEEELAAYDQEYMLSLAELLGDAIMKADEYVDFASYDADGSGTIETNELALGFVIAGQEAAVLSAEDYETVNHNNYFWAHAWDFSSIYDYSGLDEENIPAPDGVGVFNYIGVPEYEYPDSYEGIPTLAHELGHYLGIPDLYDTLYSNTNEWFNYQPSLLSIMCSGGYCISPETEDFMPGSFDIWSKIMLGWVTPEYATENGTYTINATDYSDLSKHATALLIPTQHEGELYIVENRQDTKWDAGIGYRISLDLGEDLFSDPVWRQSGLILWHVDMTNYDEYWYENSVNNSDHHPCVVPLFGERLDSSSEELTYGIFGEYPSSATGFYTKEIWEGRYAEREGAVLNLPVYGNGEDVDLRSARWLSGITVDFLDSNAASMQIEINFDNHVHYLEHHEEIPPTPDSYGMKEYWFCNVCGKYYLDEEGTQEVSYDDLLIPYDEEYTTTEIVTGTTIIETTETQAVSTESSTTEASTTETEAVTTESSTTEVTGGTISTRPTEESTTTTETTTTEATAYAVETLEEWAINDYEQKNEVRPDAAETTENEDGTVTIVLTKNEDGKTVVLAEYTIDPMTGKGTDKNGEEIDLPQTGNNALGTATAAAGAFVLVGAGLFLTAKSGILRKKEDE